MFQRFLIFGIYLREQWEEYVAGSTYNYFRYLERRRYYAERLLWAFIIVGNFITCAYLIGCLIEQFLDNAITTVYDIRMPGEPLGFPTVYICTDNALNDTRLAQFVNNSELPMDAAVLQQCIENYVNYKLVHNVSSAACRAFEASVDTGSRANLTELMLDVNHLFRSCRFASYEFPCGLLFQRVFSEVGHCFYFNSVVLDALRNGLSTVDFAQVYSLEEPDMSWDLSLKMHKTKQIYKIFLLDVLALPTLKDELRIVWNGTTSAAFSYQGTEVVSDSSLRSMSLRQGKCFFWDEAAFTSHYGNHFLFNSIYHMSYCYINCHALKFHQFCGCLPAYYGIVYRTFPFDVCNLTQLSCVESAMQYVEVSKCSRCMKSCDMTTYASEKVIEVEQLHSKVVELNITLEYWPAVIQRKHILFGTLELLVSFGGIYGLFMGLSMAMPVELFYYFTLNFLINYIRNRARMQRLAAEILTRVPRIDMSLRVKFK